MREIRKCPNCPNEFETDSRANSRALCPACSRKRINDRNNKRYHKEHPPKPQGYTIVHDPDEEGGFSAGVQMPIDDHLAMLKHRSYTLGTILERGGKQFRVIITDGRQRLIPWATPQRIYEYISEYPGVTYKELSKALGTSIGEYQLTQLESQGYYLSQDEKDKLYAVQRVIIAPVAPTKHKIYNPLVELVDSLSVG